MNTSPTPPTKDELKDFFTKLVDARPGLAETIRRTVVLDDQYHQFSKDERTHLKLKGAQDRLHLLLNPLSQNGIGSTDEKDMSSDDQ